MEYKSLPFDPPIDNNVPAESTARDLDVLISREATSGWEFIGLQNHSTVVPGSSGCFGLGATSPYPKTISVAVFRK